MLIKFTYPVKSSLVLTEHWPVNIGDIKLEWTIDKGCVTAISGTVSATDADLLPTVQPSSSPGVRLDVNCGLSSRAEEVEEAIRTVWGLIGLFTYLDISIDNVKTEWIPESEGDRERLKLFSFTRNLQKADLLKPRRLGYDLISRAMSSAKAAAHYEIPLGFLRRGTRSMYDSQYLEAFYYLFFFLETLFAPGYSNPKKVKERLCSSSIVKNAVSVSRNSFAKDSQLNVQKRDNLIKMTDEQIIHHLVDLRGNLHHHALGKPGVWHPDKVDRFHEEAKLLQIIVHSIAMKEVLKLLFSPERDKDLVNAARDSGAITKVKVEALGVLNGIQVKLQPVMISIPSHHVDAAALDHAHRVFRKRFIGGPKNVKVIEYKLMSEDASRIFAVWKYADFKNSEGHNS